MIPTAAPIGIRLPTGCMPIIGQACVQVNVSELAVLAGAGHVILLARGTGGCPGMVEVRVFVFPFSAFSV